jgi:hypothetical protein
MQFTKFIEADILNEWFQKWQLKVKMNKSKKNPTTMLHKNKWTIMKLWEWVDETILKNTLCVWRF